jgi:hypothetical protein
VRADCAVACPATGMLRRSLAATASECCPRPLTLFSSWSCIVLAASMARGRGGSSAMSVGRAAASLAVLLLVGGASAFCPQSCSGHGECSNFVCTCSSGYEGPDCSMGASRRVTSSDFATVAHSSLLAVRRRRSVVPRRAAVGRQGCLHCARREHDVLRRRPLRLLQGHVRVLRRTRRLRVRAMYVRRCCTLRAPRPCRVCTVDVTRCDVMRCGAVPVTWRRRRVVQTRA